MVACRGHSPKVVGSNPTLATKSLQGYIEARKVKCKWNDFSFTADDKICSAGLNAVVAQAGRAADL